MSTIAKLERMVLDLSDEDEGVAEALRRDAEIESDPALGISLREFDGQIKHHRKR